MVKVLVIGGGGREHALVWKIAQSPLVSKIYCYPGNGGIASLAENISLPNSAPDTARVRAIAGFAKDNHIDFTVVGPENFLADGIVDCFLEKGLKIYGPTKAAARLESSKVFAKQFMKKHGIPTASFEAFTDAGEAKAYVERAGVPIVIKADGLAAGKGVIIAQDKTTAFEAIDQVMSEKVFGEAGASVVIEEYLEGEEVSLIAFCDGDTALPMIPVQDHKRAGNGDTGPNTGGMGTYAPTSVFNSDINERVIREILNPTLKAMRAEGNPFTGTLFVGLMITKYGPKVVEYNVRFGDPETQVILPLLESDLLQIFINAVAGELNHTAIRWKKGTAVCVVAASGGYPGPYSTGKKIIGLEMIKDSLVFHAGTKLAEDGAVLTSGGRVLNLVHTGPDIREAIDGAYRDLKMIDFEGLYYRNDIGWRELARRK